MLADYTFYQNTYHGIIITDADVYAYLGERASDELALLSTKSIFSTDQNAQTQLQMCACRIADILYFQVASQKNGQKVTSESIAGYYSVNYAEVTNEQTRAQINTAIALYVGRYILGVKRVMW